MRWTVWRSRRPSVKLALIGVLVMVVGGLAAASKFLNVRNDLVRQREAVSAQWAHAPREDPGQRPALGGPGPAVSDLRELSAVTIGREFPAAAGRSRGLGEP